MTKCLFITATGTDIGKTYVSGLIVKKLREKNLNCGYFKPVLSGAKRVDEQLIPEDCRYVVEITKLNYEPMECLSYCFEESVSPHLAAERCGVKISKNKIISDFENIKEKFDYLIIEGAGGITCPINLDENYLMNDLIKDMETDILIVADGGLGTINSVLLTIEYARAKKLNIKGVILNNYKDNFMYENNKSVIQKLTGINVIATVKTGATDIDINEGIFND